MSTPVEVIAVEWCDRDVFVRLATERGWTEAGPKREIDLVERWEAHFSREFPSIAKAKAWARKNSALDFGHQPTVVRYQWPNSYRRSYERRTVGRIRYAGHGSTWEFV